MEFWKSIRECELARQYKKYRNEEPWEADLIKVILNCFNFTLEVRRSRTYKREEHEQHWPQGRVQARVLPLVVLWPGADSLTGPEALNVTYS